MATWWDSLLKALGGSGSYEPLWRAECDAAARADQALEDILDPESYCLVTKRYLLPDGRWGDELIHRCGPARLKRELAARGIQGSQAVIGNVWGGHVEMFVLGGLVKKTGRYCNSQRGRGHEEDHIEDQIAAAWEAWAAGLRGDEVRLAMDRHNADADHQGEGI